jgi:hypothetical protein
MHAVQETEAQGGCGQRAEALLAANTRLEAELDGLHRALQSRASIEQAKGVLIAFARCTEAEAFDLLVQLSQRRNVRLRAVAEALLQLTVNGFDRPDEDGLRAWLRDELARLAREPARSTRTRNSGDRPRGR